MWKRFLVRLQHKQNVLFVTGVPDKKAVVFVLGKAILIISGKVLSLLSEWNTWWST
jgi:hypothetical protein